MAYSLALECIQVWECYFDFYQTIMCQSKCVHYHKLKETGNLEITI